MTKTVQKPERKVYNMLSNKKCTKMHRQEKLAQILTLQKT